MGEVFFTSDWHLGHVLMVSSEKAHKARPFATVEEHDEAVITNVNKTCHPKDVLYVLGDVTFKRDRLSLLKEVRCKLKLVGGNHDDLATEMYLRHFQKVRGVVQYKQTVATHIPVHPAQLESRYVLNIHGHLHGKVLDDRRYVNVCLDNHGMKPVHFGVIAKIREEILASRDKTSV